MSLLLILLQAASPVSADARQKYEPFRTCLIGEARSQTKPGEDDGAILERARSSCFAANLASGSAAMFAEINSGATQQQAVERVGRLREEAEAIAAIRAVKAAGGPPPAPPAIEKRGVVLARLEIPDEISPAVTPYIVCLGARAGHSVYTGEGRQLAPTSPVAPGDTCGAERTKAAADADRLLRRQGRRDAQARRSLIEKTLNDIDAFERDSSPPPSMSRTDAPN